MRDLLRSHPKEGDKKGRECGRRNRNCVCMYYIGSTKQVFVFFVYYIKINNFPTTTKMATLLTTNVRRRLKDEKKNEK